MNGEGFTLWMTGGGLLTGGLWAATSHTSAPAVILGGLLMLIGAVVALLERDR